MAEPSPDKIVIGIVGSLIGAAIGLLPGGLTGSIGSPLTVLLGAFGGISGLVFSLMYKRYIGVLGAGGGRKGYPARDAYEALRASLSGGNLASRLYADWLPFAFDAPIFWNGRDLPTARLVREITDRNLIYAERTLAFACMRNRGYAIANA